MDKIQEDTTQEQDKKYQNIRIGMIILIGALFLVIVAIWRRKNKNHTKEK